MNTTLKGGILIGVLCGIWTFVMGFTGWYKDPAMLTAFYVVILLQIGVLVWGLRKTAADKPYGAQVGAGILMSVIGGVIIIASSLLFTTVAFPEYFDELRVAQTQMLISTGKTEAEAAAEVSMAAQFQTPGYQAVFGFIGTLVTGAVASVIIAAFARKKS
jgi:uncharacterized membrane protein